MSGTKIMLDTMRSNLPSTRGTIHINCPECTDTRGRLYITRKGRDVGSGDILLSYCHNCGATGVLQVKADGAMWVHHSQAPPPKADPDAYWKALDPVIDQRVLPIEARQWLSGAVLDDKDILQLGIRYDPVHDGLVIPRFAGNKVAYFQWRFFQGPIKYLTLRGPEFDPDHLYLPVHDYKTQAMPPLNTMDCVITEDHLSAYRVTRDSIPTMIGISLDGVHLSVAKALAISKEFRNVLIWLDNDNSEVLDKARQAHRKFGLVGKKAFVVINPEGRLPNLIKHEPKKYGPNTLTSILNYNQQRALENGIE